MTRKDRHEKAGHVHEGAEDKSVAATEVEEVLANGPVISRDPIQESPFVCFRCGRMLKTGEKMVSIVVSFETPNRQGSFDVNETGSISQVCMRCASVLLAQAVLAENLVMPQKAQGVLWEVEG